MGNLKKVDFGIKEKKGTIVTSSRNVAEVFGKEHRHVLDSIRNAMETTKEFAAEFSATNFIQSDYKRKGRLYPEFLLTKDGLSYLVMGFTGKEAAKFKITYINEFNRMEETLKSLQKARMEYPELTAEIKKLYEDPPFYRYSNEADLINRIVLGMTSKQYKEANGIDPDGSLRPHLNLEHINIIERLQKYDTALIQLEHDYQTRKQLLTEYYEKISSIHLLPSPN